MEMLKAHGPYHYQLPAHGRHTHAVPHHIQVAQQHHEMAMQNQVPQHQATPFPPPPYPQQLMMEMQQLPPLDHFAAAHHGHPNHPSPDMQPPQGQTFGDLGGYPVSSSMDLGLPGSASYKPANTPVFFSNPVHSAVESTSVQTPTATTNSFYPPSTSAHLPPSTEHPSPPTTYHQHPSPPTQQQPRTTSDLTMTYNQPPRDSAYPRYPTSTGHIPVSTTISDSEQRMVSELITSISNDSPPQQTSSTFTSANTTRPLQHIDIETNLPAYIPTSDPYTPTNTQQQQLYSPPQQPHSASSVHSNRSPSALYPSPPNSYTLQHSEVAQQNGTAIAYAHASPPSLTPSPETRDELARHSITTVEGLVQQHDYPSMLYGGADSYNYSGIRFPQEYNSETTV